MIAKLDVDMSVTGGHVAHGTVTLTDVAPEAGVTIGLAANNVAVTTPSSLTIPPGTMKGSFDITTTRVGATTDVATSEHRGGQNNFLDAGENRCRGPEAHGNVYPRLFVVAR